MAMLWQILFVLGVVIMALGVNGGPPFCPRFAWILWAVAAIVWLVLGYTGSPGPGIHCGRLLC